MLNDKILDKLRDYFCSYSITESESHSVILDTFKTYGRIIDPHTAVALASSKKCPDEYDLKVILSTAHPAKFKDTIYDLLNNNSFITDKVKSLMNMKEDMIILDNDVNIVKDLLKDNIA